MSEAIAFTNLMVSSTEASASSNHRDRAAITRLDARAAIALAAADLAATTPPQHPTATESGFVTGQRLVVDGGRALRE